MSREDLQHALTRLRKPLRQPSPPALTRLRVLRRERPDAEGHWEEFELKTKPGMTVLSLLEEIRRRPLNAAGRAVAPVAFEAACREGRCGSCTVLLNGRAQPACTTRAGDLAGFVTLAPLSKFPVTRDLVTDRSRVRRDLARVFAWTPIAGTERVVPPERRNPVSEAEAAGLARCVSCSACLEACPQYHPSYPYVGAFTISAARRHDLHPAGGLLSESRAGTLAGPGGVEDCGDANNCARICPAGIALPEAITRSRRGVLKAAARGILR